MYNTSSERRKTSDGFTTMSSKEAEIPEDTKEEVTATDKEDVDDVLTRPTLDGRSSVRVSMRKDAQDHHRVQDHFSLPGPSSEVRFRRSNVRVYEQPNSQFLLQEWATRSGDTGTAFANEAVSDNQHLYITVKQTDHTSYGLTFLRAAYTLVAVFMGGFLFIFAFELLLFLFIDLATELGVTNTQDANPWAFVAVLFSVPVFVYSLATFMTIVTRFVADTWAGHPFLGTMVESRVTTDWVAFTMYLGIPLLTMICTLFMKLDDWWDISILTWFACFMIFWGFFTCCVVYYELSASMYLICEVNAQVKEKNFLAKLKLILLSTMRTRLSGLKSELYMVDGNFILPEGGSFTDSDLEPKLVHTDLRSRATQWKCLRCFYEILDKPQRIWKINEVGGGIPFVTKYSWSLEKMFCRRSSSGFADTIPVVSGPSAITRVQAKSSVVCAIIGNLIFVFLIVGGLVWIGITGAFLGIIIVLIFVCCFPGFRSIFHNWKTYTDLAPEEVNGEDDAEKGKGEDEQGTSSAIYQICETWIISKPKPILIWTVIVSQIIFLYAWPLFHLIVLENGPSVFFFALLGLFAGARYFLNPAILLKEIGHFASIGLKGGQAPKHKGLLGVKSKREWVAKSRLSQVISIGSDSSRRFWNFIFSLIIVFFVLVAIAALASTDHNNIEMSGFKTANDQGTYVKGFEYRPQPNLPYPTCQLKKGLKVPGEIESSSSYNDNALTDAAFLAGLAYVKPGNDSQYLLDNWFGKSITNQSIAIENTTIVNDFKTAENYINSPASYKLITFPDVAPKYAIVTIRGTATLWDLMADAQLWLAAGMFQFLRAFLPLGGVWTPVLHNMIRFVNTLQSDNIAKVSFYKETTRFVEYLKLEIGYERVHITGHSLGGGLALITGSQANISAVGLSAPNAMLSREIFVPPISKQALNTLTFNIIPQRDIIPMLDDKANLYQNIECRAPVNSIIGCHSSIRSLCEIQYTCGSGGRPVVCNCTEYGYPEPTPTSTGNTTNFTEACILAAETAEDL